MDWSRAPGRAGASAPTPLRDLAVELRDELQDVREFVRRRLDEQRIRPRIRDDADRGLPRASGAGPLREEVVEDLRGLLGRSELQGHHLEIRSSAVAAARSRVVGRVGRTAVPWERLAGRQSEGE